MHQSGYERGRRIGESVSKGYEGREGVERIDVVKLAKIGLKDECITCDVRGLAGGGRLEKEAGTRRTFDVGAKRRARFSRALGEYEVRESTCMTCSLREAASVESDESRRAMIFEKVEGGGMGKGRAEVEFARRMKWLKEVCREWMG